MEYSNFPKQPRPDAPLAALLFDLDGTLVDSETIGLQVLQEMANAQGLNWRYEECLARCRGVPMPQCVAMIAAQLPPGRAPLDQALFLRTLRAAMAERFRQDLREMDGAGELLSRLKIPFAVATNGPREKASLTLALTGLDRWLDERVFCAPEVGSYKPDPGLFLHAARALGCEPAHCAVVEDSLPGILGGLAAGMRVFSLHPGAGLPEAVARQVVCIERLSALDEWL